MPHLTILFLTLIRKITKTMLYKFWKIEKKNYNKVYDVVINISILNFEIIIDSHANLK